MKNITLSFEIATMKASVAADKFPMLPSMKPTFSKVEDNGNSALCFWRFDEVSNYTLKTINDRIGMLSELGATSIELKELSALDVEDATKRRHATAVYRSA